MSRPTHTDPRIERVLFYRLEQTLRQSIRYTHRIFAEAGVDLTKDQWIVLKKLSDVPEGVSPQELSLSLGKKPASLTRIFDILERKDLVERRPNPADRRSRIIVRTANGKRTYQKLLPLVQQIRRRATQDFTGEEIQQFNQLLTRMQQNLE